MPHNTTNSKVIGMISYQQCHLLSNAWISGTPVHKLVVLVSITVPLLMCFLLYYVLKLMRCKNSNLVYKIFKNS